MTEKTPLEKYLEFKGKIRNHRTFAPITGQDKCIGIKDLFEILDKDFEKKTNCILNFKDKCITKEAIVNHNRIVLVNYKQKVKEALEELRNDKNTQDIELGILIKLEKKLELE